jgi:hypothetical protein
MKALTLFLSHVEPYVQGASLPTLIQALRDTCIDFCARTDLVQEINPQNVVADQQDYAVETTPASMHQLARVLGVMWEGKWLVPALPDGVESDVALTGAAIGEVDLVTGDPGYYFQKTPTATSVSLHPIPDTALTAGLTIKASYKPTQAATEVADVLYDEYASQIGAGAAARLMTTPGQPYTSPNAAAFATHYEQGVSEAKRRKMMGQTVHNARVRPVRFL